MLLTEQLTGSARKRARSVVEKEKRRVLNYGRSVGWSVSRPLYEMEWNQIIILINIIVHYFIWINSLLLVSYFYYPLSLLPPPPLQQSPSPSPPSLLPSYSAILHRIHSETSWLTSLTLERTAIFSTTPEGSSLFSWARTNTGMLPTNMPWRRGKKSS